MFAEKAIQAYKKVYKLPELEHEEQVSEDFFMLYNRKHFFTVITVYNLKNECFLIRDFNKCIGWELPGGYIMDNESIESSVNRIINCETGLEIDELCPVAIVKNIFKCGDKTVTHQGVAFMAMSRGKNKSYPQNFQTCFTNDIPKEIAYQNDKILRLTKEKLDRKKCNPPFEEIESVKSKNFSLLYFLHKYLVKPIGSLSSKKIRNKIFNLIEEKPNTILDASCGDSSVINDLCKKYNPEICIGNDISWKTITMMKGKNPKVIFTNHNVLNLPYGMKFDLVVFKNTLHHIEKDQQLKLLKDLKNIAKQLIIVDIDDPQNSSLLSKLWNDYYVYLLDDKGDSFLSFKEFKSIVEAEEYKKLDTGLIDTIKGKYFYANIKN